MYFKSHYFYSFKTLNHSVYNMIISIYLSADEFFSDKRQINL